LFRHSSEFEQESKSKTLKCVEAELEYIQLKQEWSQSQKFQTPYTSAILAPTCHGTSFWRDFVLKHG